MFKKVWLGVLPLVIVLISVFSLSIFLASASPVFAGQLPSYKTLCKELKDLPGWKAGKCEGMNMSGSPMGKIVFAHRPYTQGNKKIEATIACGIKATEYWAPFASNMQMESNEGFVKVTNINGHKVGISYNKQDESGVIVVPFKQEKGVGPIFVGAILALNFEKIDWKKALKIAEEFDWENMGKLLK